MPDWLERAVKTFIQAFLGVLIPEIVALLNNVDLGVLENWKIWVPLLSAALAAGISAAWNIVLEHLKEE